MQHMNVSHWASTQEYSDPYDMHIHHHPEPFTNVSLFELAPLLSSPTSTCTPTLDSSSPESSPGPSRLSADEAPSMLHSEPQIEPTARSQKVEAPMRRPGPRRLSCAPTPVAEDPPTNTGPDMVGRRAPKPRRITRAVQPLACFFCRGRKIACGPPVNLGTGDRTCEYVAIRPFNSVSCFTHRHIRARRDHGRLPTPPSFPLHNWTFVFSGADCSRFLYW